MIESQFKIVQIPEAVSLSFQGFDFVIDSFDLGGGDAMLEVIQDSI